MFRDHLDATARKSYINAVLCLQSRPSILDQTKYPGAKTRYDDFLAVHINQTLTIHGTGNFLAWHRYLTWTYEKALRDECGYDGYQPVSANFSGTKKRTANIYAVLELGYFRPDPKQVRGI